MSSSVSAPEHAPAPLSRIARQTAYYVLSFGINAAGRYFMLALLWRSLDFHGQQAYAQLQAALGLVCVLADVGLENAIVRFYHADKSVFGFAARRLKVLGFSLVLPAACLFGFWWFFRFHSSAGFAVVLAGTGFALFQISAAFYRSETRVGAYAILNLIRNGVCVAAIAFLFYGFKNLSLESWFAVQAMVAFGLAGYVFFKISRNKSFKKAPAPAAMFSRYAWLVLAANVILWLESLWDILFITRYFPAQLPLYQLALDYGSFLAMASVLISKAWPPVYFTMFADRTPFETIGKHLVSMQWIAGAGLVALFIVSPPGMHLLRGQPLPVGFYPVIAIMLSMQALVLQFTVLRPLLEQKNDVAAIAGIFAAGATITLAGNFFLVPRYGVLGAAISGLASVGFIFWGMVVRLGFTRAETGRSALPVLAGQQLLFGALMVALSLVLEKAYARMLPGW